MQQTTFVVQTWHFLSPILFSGLCLWNCEHCYLCPSETGSQYPTLFCITWVSMSVICLCLWYVMCNVYYLCVHVCYIWYHLCVHVYDMWCILPVCPCLWYVACITFVSMSMIRGVCYLSVNDSDICCVCDLCGVFYLCVHVCDIWSVIPLCQCKWRTPQRSLYCMLPCVTMAVIFGVLYLYVRVL